MKPPARSTVPPPAGVCGPLGSGPALGRVVLIGP